MQQSNLRLESGAVEPDGQSILSILPVGRVAATSTHAVDGAREALQAAILAVMADLDIIERSRAYRWSKRATDIAVALVALLLLAPLFLIVAIAIRLDSSGPAFFLQDRVGYRGRVFRIVKFRTMTNGSVLQLQAGSHKHEYDRRITRVGKILRKTSIDELPQLFNVLRGEMSLVGPRPEIVEIVLARYERWQYQRFLVPQGLTGWWQVTGRGQKLLFQNTADDLHYIEHATFWLDLAILLRTIPAVLRRDGAF